MKYALLLCALLTACDSRVTEKNARNIEQYKQCVAAEMRPVVGPWGDVLCLPPSEGK